LTDRVIALKDILPPSARRRLISGFETAKSYSWSGLKLAGKSAWILSTSVLLVGVPYVLALVDEQQVVEIEKEQRMREMGQEVRES
jgi:import receptor subunit TOM22